MLRKQKNYFENNVCLDEAILCSQRQGREWYRYCPDIGLPKRVKEVKKFDGGAR